MAVSFASIGTADASVDAADDALSLGVPSGVSAGDMLIACIANAINRNATASGWTKITLDNENIAVFYRVATGSEGASVTFTFSVAADTATGVILRFTGASTTTAPTPATIVNHAGWDTTVDFPSTTVSESGSGLVFVGTVPASSSDHTISSMSRGTARYSTRINSYAITVLVGTEDNVSSGSIAAATATISSAINNKYGQVVVIPPAGATTKPWNYYAQAS